MECRWVGHTRWAWEDKLEISSICVILQGLQCGWLPMGRSIPCMCLNHNKKLVGSVWCLAPLCWSENGLCLGSEEPCHLWLLQRFSTLSNWTRGVFIESMGLINIYPYSFKSLFSASSFFSYHCNNSCAVFICKLLKLPILCSNIFSFFLPFQVSVKCVNYY